MTIFQSLFTDIYFLAIFGCVVAFLISNRIYPVIIYTVRIKNLMDEPISRKVHSKKIPTLGGVGLFTAFALSLILLGIIIGLERTDLIKLLSLLAATMILFFLGMKDDLIAISPRNKLLGQLVASAIVIFSTDMRIYSFDGLLGIGELPYAVSVLFTLFVFILVINSFNLIDGIDGLAGAVSIVVSGFFSVFFLLNENYLLSFVSFIVIGAVLGYLRYNLSDSHKLFMGDSGSLFLGLLLAYQGIGFLIVNEAETSSFTAKNAPMLLLAVLSFPLLDTLRVFTLRAKKRQSPFDPDRNHIHHRLLDLGFSHKQSTLLILIGIAFNVELAILTSDLYINLQLFICVVVGSLFYLSPFLKVFEKSMGAEPTKEVETLKQDNPYEIKSNKEFRKPIVNKNEQIRLNEDFFPQSSLEQHKQEVMGKTDPNNDFSDEGKIKQRERSIRKKTYK